MKTTTTLFEKYRPTSFDEVLGQDKAIKKVKLLLDRGWGGRAWWLSGSSGTGKTTIARIIARCGADDFYVTEYDSADAMSVSEIGRLERDMSYFAPGKGGRAFIINEAHGTTQGHYTASIGPSGAYTEPRMHSLYYDKNR